ncbi:DMT family transporter [Burkholderia ubonensis]|uniref:DMT family transporter n=1 Tax=Burkholderia ubonensis TaxID=101571 RepID=UPI000AC7A70F|nr:DMT family transporter [Burkholderia ubonensis]
MQAGILFERTMKNPSLAPPEMSFDARMSRADLASLVAMMLLWGLSWPAMKYCLQAIPPLWMAALRFSSAAACLFAILWRRGEVRVPPRSDLPIVVSVGVLQMTAFTALGALAMQHVGAGHAVLLAYTTPLWVTLGSVFLPGRISGRQLIATGMGVSGIAIVCLPDLWTLFSRRGTGAQQGSGDLMLVVGAICWAVVIVHVRHHRWRSLPLALAPWQMLLAGVPLTLAALIFEGVPSIHWTASLAMLVVFIGPVATCICFVISAEVGRRIPPVTMSLATLGVPITGLVGSVVLLDEMPSAGLLAGFVLIVGSLACVLTGSRRERSGR